MPTENRSSPEIVWFPRELSDDLAELIAHRARVCGGGAFEIWEAICEGFGKPAEQHQGEPVALPADWQDQLMAEMSRRFELSKRDDDRMVIDDTQIGVEFASDWVRQRLITHADPAEVERLRAVIEQQKNLIASLRAELVESHSIDASAKPSAPVERSEWEAFYHTHMDLFGCYPRTDDKEPDFALSHANRWKLWQARAALERKPQVKS